MLNISSILKHIKQGLITGLERYVIIDDEHVLDKVTGVKLHIYDDWFKMTHNDDVIATMRDFDTTVEQPLVWEIKALITPAEVMESHKENYMEEVKERRERFSYRFEYPEPIGESEVILEKDTEEYEG